MVVQLTLSLIGGAQSHGQYKCCGLIHSALTVDRGGVFGVEEEPRFETYYPAAQLNGRVRERGSPLIRLDAVRSPD